MLYPQCIQNYEVSVKNKLHNQVVHTSVDLTLSFNNGSWNFKMHIIHTNTVSWRYANSNYHEIEVKTKVVFVETFFLIRIDTKRKFCSALQSVTMIHQKKNPYYNLC